MRLQTPTEGTDRQFRLITDNREGFAAGLLNHPRIWKAMKAKGALNEMIMKAVGSKPGNRPCETATILIMRNATIPTHKRRVVLLLMRGVGIPDATKCPGAANPSLTLIRKGSHPLGIRADDLGRLGLDAPPASAAKSQRRRLELAAVAKKK